MLDDRLINTRFTLQTAPTGTVVLYGIHYHYHVADDSKPGDVVVVTAAAPLGLTVRNVRSVMKY